MSRWRTLTGILIVLVPLTGSVTSAEEVVIRDPNGVATVLYRESHALVIGVADYEHDASWHDLPRIPDEVDKVVAALERQGFNVEPLIDPTGEELRTAIRRFVVEHGFTTANEDNRLLIFFSGHGHTRPIDRGYLVPVDAPDPYVDEAGFLDKALDMLEVETLARRIEAKHALFVFDSCFSGTLFETRARPEPGQAYIRASTAAKVRQFITAGDAGQEVPAESIFTPLFLRGLEGEADTNDDGYITGVELGLYLMQRVPDYNPTQTPQYGKIRDIELDRGDFVFGPPDVGDQALWPDLPSALAVPRDDQDRGPAPAPGALQKGQIGIVSAKPHGRYVVIEIVDSVSDGDPVYILSQDGVRTNTEIKSVNTPVPGKGAAFPSSLSAIEVGDAVFRME